MHMLDAVEGTWYSNMQRMNRLQPKKQNFYANFKGIRNMFSLLKFSSLSTASSVCRRLKLHVITIISLKFNLSEIWYVDIDKR